MIYIPCYKCEVRKLGCHDNCPAYSKYKSQVELVNKNRKEYMNNKYDDYVRESRNLNLGGYK